MFLLLQIISQSEALKRRSIVFEEPIPLPDLIGESTILTDEHVTEVSLAADGFHDGIYGQGIDKEKYFILMLSTIYASIGETLLTLFLPLFLFSYIYINQNIHFMVNNLL
mgnify:CR=1 FL=1